MKRLPLLLLFLAGMSAAPQAQEFDLANSHLPVLSLDGQWRFHKGDDPKWADPSFNDSGWALLRSDRNWAEEGHPGYSGMAWYRFHVTLPEGLEHVSISLPYILTSYQVYANGQLIGSYGQLPPHAVPYWGGGWYRIYSMPPVKTPDRSVEIAIRVWHWRGWSADFGGGPSFGGGLIGDADEIEARDKLSRGSHHWSLAATMILALLETLAGAGALFLYFLRRSEREYLWFGAMMLLCASAGWLTLSFAFDVWNQLLSDPLTDAIPLVAVGLAELAFYRNLLKGMRTRLFHAALACILLTAGYLLVKSYALIDPAFGTGLSSTTVTLWETLLQLPLDAWILLLLITRARQNSLDARLLVAPVLLQKLAQMFQGGAILTYNLGWQERLGYNIVLFRQPFQIELLQVVDALFLLAILGILILRFTRTRAQEEHYAMEFDAARSVQQLLIPEKRPQTPGLAIESEYRPAREVGGDFFQVIPNPAGDGALVVIGDVAGKGMEAGMLVAHILGIVRNEATHEDDPARILNALNAQLALSRYALATCLALRIDANGAAELANAGHLAPYLNGAEMPMEGALPLGASLLADFPTLRFQLAAGDTLVLMTDGVVEARDGNGQLFGFERIGEMLRRNTASASLASAAQAFGQEDDISVLTVTRLPAAVSG